MLEQLKEVGVPKKCNTLNIANNKIPRWLQHEQGHRVIGGYDSMREGAKWAKYFLPILVLIDKSGYMSFLGKGHVVLDFQVNI
jgi:hypothetical protein